MEKIIVKGCVNTRTVPSVPLGTDDVAQKWMHDVHTTFNYNVIHLGGVCGCCLYVYTGTTHVLSLESSMVYSTPAVSEARSLLSTGWNFSFSLQNVENFKNSFYSTPVVFGLYGK